jgi:hypothetical protein
MRIWNLDDDSCCDNPITIVDFSTDTAVDVFLPGPPGPSAIPRPFKAGTVPAGSFTGSPKKALVVFAMAFADATYSIQLTGQDSRIFTYDESTKLASGFTINANSNGALTGEVSWVATMIGETS